MRADQNGRPQPSRKITRDEKNRRRDAVMALWRQGATRMQICKALDVGLDTVGNDLRARGADLTRRSNPTIPDPLPIEWLEPDAPRIPSKPAYQNSVTVELWASFLREARSQHHVNRLAWDAADAEAAGDELWLEEAKELFQSVITEATRLKRVLSDEAARRRGQRDEEDPPRMGIVHHLRPGQVPS